MLSSSIGCAEDSSFEGVRVNERVARILRKLRWIYGERGISGLAEFATAKASRVAPDREVRHPFDTKYGVDTSGFIDAGYLDDGQPSAAHITSYVGIPPQRFEHAMKRWSETAAHPVEEYTFLDLGCGKGRAVLMATRMPFKEAIGVELNAELARVADGNLEIWRRGGHGAAPARIVCGDAVEYTLPPGPCLVYLVNPFRAPLVRRMLESLDRQANTSGQTIDVIYQNTEYEAIYAEFPAFRLLWSDTMPLSYEDAVASVVYTIEDRCNGYRR
jgi:hypothetical protein